MIRVLACFVTVLLVSMPAFYRAVRGYSSYKSQPNVCKFSGFFSSQWSSQNHVGHLRNLDSDFDLFFFFFFENYKFTIAPYGKTTKPQLSGTRAIAKRNGVKFGILCTSRTYMGYHLPGSVQCHFGITRCTVEFSENTIFKTLLLLHL